MTWRVPREPSPLRLAQLWFNTLILSIEAWGGVTARRLHSVTGHMHVLLVHQSMRLGHNPPEQDHLCVFICESVHLVLTAVYLLVSGYWSDREEQRVCATGISCQDGWEVWCCLVVTADLSAGRSPPGLAKTPLSALGLKPHNPAEILLNQTGSGWLKHSFH